MKRLPRHRVAPRLVGPRGIARLAWAVWIGSALATSAASGSETQWWIVERSADHGESESRGVVVRADGTMALGPAAVRAPVDSVEVLWAIAVRSDGSLVLGGDSGRLFTWTRSSGVRPWVRLDAGQVLSLAADGNDVIAGTAPRGIVYRVRPNGDTLRVATTGERYVWALAPAGGGAWYAATGVRGRLLPARSAGSSHRHCLRRGWVRSTGCDWGAIGRRGGHCPARGYGSAWRVRLLLPAAAGPDLPLRAPGRWSSARVRRRSTGAECLRRGWLRAR